MKYHKITIKATTLTTIKVRIQLHEIPMDFSTVPSMDFPMAPVVSFGAAASDHLRAATRGAAKPGKTYGWG